MGEWEEMKLSDVCDIIPGYAFKSAEFLEEGIPVVKIKDITPPVVDFSGNQCVDASIAKNPKLNKYKVGKDDFVAAMTGATIGKVGRVRTDVTAYINQRVAKFEPLPTVDREYVYYQLLTNDFQEFITNNVDSNSAQENISGTSIGRFPVLIPELREQRSIASILSSLDAKIDLLHRQNKTLEGMAEALFRQWFVEEAEEGWEEVGLLDVVKLVPGGTPKTTQPNYWDGDIMWISVREISENHKGFVNYAYKTITEEGLNNSAANLLPRFGTVISARGTVGKIGLLAQPMAYSQSNFGVLPKDSSNFFFTYMLVHNSIEELHSNSYGAVFDTITTQSFQTIRHRLPDPEVINSFETLVRPMFLKMLNNTEQITSLTKLRDTLLPKLMSGEVRVEMSTEQVHQS